MVECANCGKHTRDNFEYCRICGTKLDGGELGDYSTNMMNVFRHGDEYLYLFSEKGNQVVLRADSLDEIAVMVGEKKYPWEFRDTFGSDKPHIKETPYDSDSQSGFLNAGSLDEQDMTPADLTGSDDESYVPEFEVERVGE